MYDLSKRYYEKHVKPAFVDGYNKCIDDLNSAWDDKIHRQNKMVSKALVEMISRGLVKESDAVQVKQYMLQIYSIGLNDGGLVYAHKKEVTSYNKEGKKVQTYRSVAHAARALDVSKSLISKAASGKMPTAAGYFWKYEKS